MTPASTTAGPCSRSGNAANSHGRGTARIAISNAHAQPSTRIPVGTIHDRIVASGMVGQDGHRGWLYYLAVDPAQRRRGYGAEIIALAERYLIDIGCRKLMMMVRPGQPRLNAYYERLGFQDNKIVTFGKRLIADHPAYDR